ncbi:MAG TPA: DUF4153 domain-containing protein [Allosphingosinicella sp.]|jgi:hypothetical protein
MIDEAEAVDHGPWPERAAILGGLGLLFGLLFWKLTKGVEVWQWTNKPLEMAGATFVAVSGVVFAFALERLRWTWSVLFAAACGFVAALVCYWNGAPQDWGSDEGWQFTAALIAVLLAVPLFQSARDRGAFRLAPRSVHAHLWTGAIIGAVAMVFVGAVILLTFLLAALFDLIGIRLLRDAMWKGWFMWPLACGAFGAAVGLLRDRDSVIGTAQKVVRAILSVLAPALALGLVLFVAALPFTGLEPLWEKTKSTTPILLVCVFAAIVLLNAVIGNAPEEEAKARPLRWSAAALAAVALPLTLVAAVSTGLRIDQYGFTPDRLWASVFILVMLGFAAVYLYALVRSRAAWPAQVRRLNVALALGTCALALFLALPILSFGALSTRDQLARLQSGQVAAEKFDWAALRFDFGPSGRAALQRLAESGTPALRPLARQTLAAQDRFAVPFVANPLEEAQGPPPEPRIRTVPEGLAVPPGLAAHIRSAFFCRAAECRLLFDTPSRALLVGTPCPRCRPEVQVFLRAPDGSWAPPPPAPPVVATAAPARPRPQDQPASALNGRLEVRAVEYRQLFIDGEPTGPVFAP